MSRFVESFTEGHTRYLPGRLHCTELPIGADASSHFIHSIEIGEAMRRTVEAS